MALNDSLAAALQGAEAEYRAAREDASALRYRLEQKARQQLLEADRRQEAARAERLRLVREARGAGASWGDLARVLEISRQAAAALYKTAMREKSGGDDRK